MIQPMKPLLLYYVYAHSSYHTHTIYKGTNLSQATLEFNSVNLEDFSDDFGGFATLEQEEYIGEPAEDFELYFDDEATFKPIGNIEVLHSRTISPANEQSDTLLMDVSIYFSDLYGGIKYHTLELEDKFVQLRLADHSENLLNIDRYGSHDYYLSVVIADKNYTSPQHLDRHSNEKEIYFTSEDSFQHVIETINQTLKQFNHEN
jgi:hypothetical protein